MASHVDDDDVQKLDTIDSLGRTQRANHVNESGLYALIFGSTKEEPPAVPDPSRSPEDEEAIEKIRSLMRKVDGDPRIRAAVREALKKIGAWQEPESQPEPPPTITYPASEERVVIPDPHAPGFLGTYTPPAEYRVELDEKPSGRATSDPESPAGRT